MHYLKYIFAFLFMFGIALMVLSAPFSNIVMGTFHFGVSAILIVAGAAGACIFERREVIQNDLSAQRLQISARHEKK